ncbi:hypothetical protein D083_1882 [Dickeya solani RNS 08.23.3.1.A]|nr:hypothetical protein D083_1882 [Dickeya solani RNS 08.23.3.1.A]
MKNDASCWQSLPHARLAKVGVYPIFYTFFRYEEYVMLVY